ncbi:MAG: DUF262 domain-containing HNH endonuclease family protein [Candidatus Omnitrophica bacterium]|nr:DUF262 domain-containing HNH endonuclease family protein [Candidatus Omnitrophota bacterium]
MKADAKGFKFLVMEGKVKIPFFQRTYVWTEDNWEELLQELRSENKVNNFLGTIISKQLPSASGQPKELEVIDGQQRLTTLSILLKALYDSLSDEDKRNCEGEIMGILRYKKDYTSSTYELRIEHSYVDSEAYRKVMENTLNIAQITEEDHLILRCYKYFMENLEKLTIDERKTLINKILNPENKMLVVIDLDEKDNEQSIFDTLNTAGVRLTVAEIVKNAIFKKAIELSDKSKAIELYKKTWEETFLKDEETLKYWETERTTGRFKRDNIEILLHCIGVIKGFYDPDKHALLELSKLYKNQLKEFNSINELTNFINEIIEYAKIYREKIVTFDKSDTFSFGDSIPRLLHILEVLEISTFHPFILAVFKKYQNDENNLKDILGKLEKFIIRNQLAKVENVKNYSKLCKQFIVNQSNLDDKLEEISWDRVSDGLRNISNRDATLILFWIELYRRYKDNKYDEKELKYDYTLEHIMPIKWEEYWNFDKVPHPNSNLSREEQKQDRNEKIKWLGNMTLLKSRLNTSLSNQGFEKKIKGEGRKKGIKDYATLYITKDDIVEPFNNDDKVWNEKKIEDRTENLLKGIKAIWGNS